MKTGMRDAKEIVAERTATSEEAHQEIRHRDTRARGLLKINKRPLIMSKKRQINIQVQEVGSRVKMLEVELMLCLLYLAADDIQLKISVTEDQQDRYVNIGVLSKSPALLWCRFCDVIQYYKSSGMKNILENWIVTMEGEHGWDDYLLLDTFSPEIPY
jgi:hypothetical protein